MRSLIHITLPYCQRSDLRSLHDSLQTVPQLVHPVLHLASPKPMGPQSVIYSGSLQPPCQHATYGSGGIGLLQKGCTWAQKFNQRRKIDLL
jgi:hypothetical protein